MIKTKSFFVNKILSCKSNCSISLPINSHAFQWLLDTGASISAIKYKHVLEERIGFCKENISINGIGGKVTTIGYCYLNFNVNGHQLKHKFYVFDFLPIRANGIIGQDFLTKYKAVLDFNHNIITLSTYYNNINLPINTISNNLDIPPRCESIHYITTDIEDECLVCASDISDGIYLASSLVKPVCGRIPIKILNTTEDYVTLREIKPTIHSLSDYNLCSFSQSESNAFRVRKLLSLLQLSHLNGEEQTSVENLCAKYSDIFYLPGDSLTTTDIYKHSITLQPNTTPIFSKPYRLPHAQKKEIDRQIGKMLQEGIIEESRSEWSSPVLLVPKKIDTSGQKKWRLVIDYRKLNNCIENDKFPLPNITEILDSLSGCIYFSHLDLYQGFHNVELDKDSRKYTAFCSGQYQMTRMPMGLKTSPSSFSRMMTMAMAGLSYDKCLIYQDDLIVFGRNLGEKNKNLQDVFERLRKVNLKLNPEKCEFFKKEMLYLGHVVSREGVVPDPEKIKIVESYPCPKSVEEVKRFTAFVNYYRKFIPNFAEKAYPLHQLCRKNATFKWDQECQKTFEDLKQCLVSPPVLQYPDFTETNQFIVQTDASGYSIGAILSNGNKKPVAYASRGLNSAERRYPTIEKELLAIVWAVKYFRPYLYGTKFKILTDHRPLIYLFNMRDPSSRLMKFRLILEEYDYIVEYVKGSDNAAADALSRISFTSEDLKHMGESYINVTTRAQARKLQSSPCYMTSDSTWPDQPGVVGSHTKPREAIELRFIEKKELDILREKNKLTEEKNAFCYVESKLTIYINPDYQSQLTRAAFVRELGRFCKLIDVDEICIVKNRENKEFIEELLSEIKSLEKRYVPRIYIINDVRRIDDKDDRKVILNDFHLLPTSGHAGMRRMANNIKKYYYWPGLERDVREFVKKCTKCQKEKYARLVKEPMVITTTATTAFEKIFLDLVGPLDRDCYNFSYILTIQCELTKYVVAHPLISKKSNEVAQALVNSFILRYGLPKEIATDRGSEFMSTVFQEVCKLLKITHLNSTAYHHQSIGALENSHKNLGSFLRIQSDNHPEAWSQWLPYWCFSFNTTVHSETKFTPFELVFGKICSLPSNLDNNIVEPLYNHESYPLELKFRLQLTQKEARENLIRSKIQRKNTYDKSTNPVIYKPNDLILVKNENSNKMDSIYSGPFEVVKDMSPNVQINKNGKLDVIHKNRTKLFTPAT